MSMPPRYLLFSWIGDLAQLGNPSLSWELESNSLAGGRKSSVSYWVTRLQWVTVPWEKEVPAVFHQLMRKQWERVMKQMYTERGRDERWWEASPGSLYTAILTFLGFSCSWPSNLGTQSIIPPINFLSGLKEFELIFCYLQAKEF